VDVRAEYCDDKEAIEKFGMQFLHVEIDDRYSPAPEQLEKIFKFVEPLFDAGKKILIHCQNGCGRAPLIVVAILANKGMNIPDAVNLIEKKHPQTGFSHPQEEFIYIELDKFLKSKS
jgi:protein-tyrosine phosphatase